MMGPKLRSGSSVKSQKTPRRSSLEPRPRVGRPPSASKAMRPRAQRQSGKQSRLAAVNTDSPSRTQPDAENLVSGSGPDSVQATPAERSSFFGIQSDYSEPNMRQDAPSFTDTPWSGVSHNTNPILGTMRPLGATPSDADRVKAGLGPTAPRVKVVSGKRGPQRRVVQPDSSVRNAEDFFTTMLGIPVPTSEEFNVNEMKSALEDALTLAAECQNATVARALLRLWDNSNKDSFVLSVLGSVMQDDPSPQDTSAFQSLVRGAWSDVQAQEPNLDSTQPNGRRRGSESSTSSLSSAKSLDAETFAPAIAGGAENLNSRGRPRGKPGRPPKNARGRKSVNQRAGDDHATASRKRTLEEDEADEAMTAKRQRMHKTFPDLVAHESTLRSSLASESPSAVSSPPPADTGIEVQRTPKVKNSKGKSATRNQSPSESDDSENYDYCHQCRASGQLLCCDGCANSFHFSCLDPPLDPANPPAGNWYCPKCAMSEVMGRYMDKLNKVGRKDFSLPLKLRNHFLDSRSGEKGVYEDAAPIPKYTGRSPRGSKLAQYDDEPLTRTHENINGTEVPITCYACGGAADGKRPTIACDYCPLCFHLDCLDPPRAKPPYQFPNSDRARTNWMCPNHAYHDLFWFTRDEDGNGKLGRIRRPRNPRLIDVDVLPTEPECERVANETDQGVLYRVSERGLNEDFVERAKWSVYLENFQADTVKCQADEYYQYTKNKYDDLLKQASDFYSSRPTETPALPSEDATLAVLNSRTDTEREAVSNLVAFAQSSDFIANYEPGRINLLIDQLKADAPSLPKPTDEIGSLRTLQNLIDQRIQRLDTESSTPERAKSVTPMVQNCRR